VLDGFLGQVQADFAAICAGEFSEAATIGDGAATIEVRCVFDETTETYDTEAQMRVLHPEPRITVAETAVPAGFDLRRPGLLVSVRGRAYKIRERDWESDGLGQLVIYLTPVRP
jgi:hypothetical protein